MVSPQGKASPEREARSIASDRLGKPGRYWRCERHRECGLERRLRAGEDRRLAGYARASFIVLQISESKSSLQEAPALTKCPPQEAR